MSDDIRSLSLLERETLIFQDPELLNKICRHVSSGGTVIQLADIWKIHFADVMRWIRSEDYRKEKYNQALQDREEWTYERILMELRAIGTVDIRELYDEKGNLKAVSDWPDGAASSVAGVDVFEEFEGHGQDRQHVGTVRKVKLIDKLKALELAGKTQKMFTDRVESTTVVKLEDIVAASWSDVKKPIHSSVSAEEIKSSPSGIHDQTSDSSGSYPNEGSNLQDMSSDIQSDDTI